MSVATLKMHEKAHPHSHGVSFFSPAGTESGNYDKAWAQNSKYRCSIREMLLGPI